jgi:hypothetical protein
MKKSITVISTYPETGSRNIGDQLITDAVCNLIKTIEPETSVHVVWRADSWERVHHLIEASDHVIFACLAMRKNMHTDEYPYLNDVINSGVPYSAISAGTSLPIHWPYNLFNSFSKATTSLLREFAEKADFFTTRGALSQQVCEILGLDRVVMTGDIAFFDDNLAGLQFKANKSIENIVISDPHYAADFLDTFTTLLKGTKELFPGATITIALHGENPIIESYLLENDIKHEKIYLSKTDGLRIYKFADLHLGFRVHAHVSALKYRNYSYLIEQDGRGADYGLTIDRNISVAGYGVGRQRKSFKTLLKLALRIPLASAERGTTPAYKLLAMIANDKLHGFDKFEGLESQLQRFTCSLEDVFKEILLR